MIKGVLGRFFYALCDDAYINKKPLAINQGLLEYGSPTWARTRDTRINSPMLYRLSYWGMMVGRAGFEPATN